MSYWDRESDYYELFEFEEECEHLKDLLKASALRELKEENEKLKKELQESAEIVNNYKNKVQEVERQKKIYEISKEQLTNEITRRIKNEKIKELLKTVSQKFYSVQSKFVKKDKCDKCDNNRYIQFKSPISGKMIKESCPYCGESILQYYVKESEIKSISYDNGEFSKEIYFDDDWYENSIKIPSHLYCIFEEDDNIAFEDCKRNRDILFKIKENAEECAEYLNKKYYYPKINLNKE